MMAQICKEKSEPAYAHGGVQNPCYRSIVSNTDTFENQVPVWAVFISMYLLLNILQNDIGHRLCIGFFKSVFIQIRCTPAGS